MKRRSFFKSLVQAAAVIALAPRLAFKDVVEAPSIIDPEYRCVMNLNPDLHGWTLYSTTHTVLWADPTDHVVITNFDDAA